MKKIYLGSARASSLRSRRIFPLLIAGIAAFGIGAVGHSMAPAFMEPVEAIAAAARPMAQELANSAPVRAMDELHQMTAAALAPVPVTVTREVELGRGQSFAGMLLDTDVAPEDATAAAAALTKAYDHRKMKAGQEVTLTFQRIGADETLMNATFQPELTKEVTIARNAAGAFVAQVKQTPVERQRLAARGEITSSFYEAGEHEGVPHAVMAAMLRAYSHTVDFQRDIHAGDRFEVLYDQPMTQNGTPVGQGTIIYAALEIGGKTKSLYRVTFEDGTVDYFDEKGHSAKRTLLRTPVEGARVTSSFGMRMHPLLGYSKMHQGIDFGAAIGTPIFAAGAGVIDEVGTKNGYGRYIRIRHNGQMETAYAHMSRFGRGMYRGARVNQGDVIGFVGQSGRATGPHLHYEVLVSHRQVNPMSVNLPTGRVLEGKMLSQFKQSLPKVKQEFASLLKSPAETKNAPVLAMKSQHPALTKVAANAPAFGKKSAAACGLRGGC